MSTTHARKLIRDAIITGLTGLATTEDRVYSGRTRPLKKGHSPALLVYARSETSKRDTHGVPPTLERSCLIHIEGRVQTPDVPDDLLDRIAAEVEAGMASMSNYAGRTFLNGLASNLQLQSTEIIAEADSEQHTGGIRLEYLVTYRAAEGVPGISV